MKSLKKLSIIFIIALITMPIFISCTPHANEYNDVEKILNNETVKQSLTDLIKSGKTMQDFLPPTIVMIFGTLIPITAVVGFFLFLLIFIKLYHKRTMAMIEKGTYQQKPIQIRWDLIFLFTGLILAFVGPGISIYMMAYYGIQNWSIFSGIIPFFIGLAFLIFYKIYVKNK